jgi:hypothetical protein
MKGGGDSIAKIILGAYLVLQLDFLKGSRHGKSAPEFLSFPQVFHI